MAQTSTLKASLEFIIIKLEKKYQSYLVTSQIYRFCEQTNFGHRFTEIIKEIDYVMGLKKWDLY